ncbi:hypothetical protein D7Z94_24505 [Ulvibacterium marinum]|uniref:Uncharacterized protein n=1 Tax=Ulvibacterium marinum TaxID=2419782 RepID=A0A3B0BVB9_9FLAO|nr:hypothetical protein D7Z94_24505 [Ulvibacterium marinum]
MQSNSEVRFKINIKICCVHTPLFFHSVWRIDNIQTKKVTKNFQFNQNILSFSYSVENYTSDKPYQVLKTVLKSGSLFQTKSFLKYQFFFLGLPKLIMILFIFGT